MIQALAAAIGAASASRFLMKWIPGKVVTDIANWTDPPYFMGKLTISMAIFNSYVSHCERVCGKTTKQCHFNNEGLESHEDLSNIKWVDRGLPEFQGCFEELQDGNSEMHEVASRFLMWSSMFMVFRV